MYWSLPESVAESMPAFDAAESAVERVIEAAIADRR
jgi:hypothetical protein